MRKLLAIIFALTLVASTGALATSASACVPDDPGYPGFC